ncbi:jg6213 [Pararge aegeria aegeria]|uniref:Jg6213 protein n=1 Tax=Pararge aegeria aegeria TaxID=348720 RepID=A0A8S4RLV4_9NEOP|nr:jg6213 [Pararge aegeria aegeria]
MLVEAFREKTECVIVLYSEIVKGGFGVVPPELRSLERLNRVTFNFQEQRVKRLASILLLAAREQSLFLHVLITFHRVT